MRQPETIDVADRGNPVEALDHANRTLPLGWNEPSSPAPSCTITKRLRALLAANPSRVAFTFIHRGNEVPIDYAALLDRAARYGTFFLKAGTAPGDVVLIVLQHDEHLLYAFFGALLVGARPAILAYPTPKLDPQRWAQAATSLIANTSAELLVTYRELAGRLGMVARSARVEVKPNLADHAPLAERRWHAGTPDELVFLQFSSGTTGLQKGLGLTHRAVIAQIEDYSTAIKLTSDDRIVSWLPLYHDMGLIACTLLPALTATPCVWLSPFEWVKQPRILLEAVTRHAATLCWLPNFTFSFLARAVSDLDLQGLDLSSVRSWVNCSEPIHAASFESFITRFGSVGVRPRSLATCYAMAENTFAVTQSAPGEGYQVDCVDADRFQRDHVAVPVEPEHPRARRQVSSGHCIDGVSVQIRSDDGRVLSDRKVGRIFVRGRSQFGGYWPDTTSQLQDYFDTGDLGYLADGQLYVTGRSRDLIICRGRNIYPQDVEALAGDFAGIIPGRMVAVGVADATLGTEDILLLAETESAEVDALAAELREHCLRSLDLPALRVGLVSPGWLIKTSSGKIARSANLEKYLRCLDRAAPAPAHPSTTKSGTTSDRLLAYVRRSAQTLATESFSAHTLIDEVLDSLATVELFAFVESEFGVRCGQRAVDIAQSGTLGDLACFVEEEQSRPRHPQRVLEVAVGGDDSLAATCVGQALQDCFEKKLADRWLNISIFFRRRIDCLISDIREFARRGVEPGCQQARANPPSAGVPMAPGVEPGCHGWSPDLQRLLDADAVLLDYFAEMLCTPEIRLRRPDDPRENPAREWIAMRWLPVYSDVDLDGLFVEQARLLTGQELADCYDQLASLIKGRLVVLTYGEACARTYAWYPWLREVNATLRTRSQASAWQLCDTGQAMDALSHGHYRAVFAGLPDEHRDRARALMASFFEQGDLAASASSGRAVRGVTGRRKAAHSCARLVSAEWVERWSEWYRCVAIVGEEFSCRGLPGGLEQRGTEVQRFRRLEDVPRSAWQAIILTSGRFERVALEALAEEHGRIPIESPLTQAVTLTDPERLFRYLLVEMWQRLAAQGKSVGLYGAGAFARYFLRVVAEARQPRVAWLADDDARKQGQVVFGRVVQPPDGQLPDLDAVLVLTERDKDFQRRALDRFESSSEMICPAAYSSTIPAPKCWTFAPSPQEMFLNPDQKPVHPGRWDA
ncbi:MAG: AMP-binding protein [Phycisphaerae bacterium]